MPVVSSAFPNTVWTFRLTPDGNGSFSADVASNNTIQQTARQNILVLLCSTSNTSVSVTGSIAFQNPYGYLPGKSFLLCGFACCRVSVLRLLPALIYAFPTFYAALAAGHAVLLVGFGFVMLRNRQWIVPLQLGILCVIILGLLEVSE
jgi:hypothetical protein